MIALLIFLAVASTATTRPNIIFFLADDLGYGEVNAHNSTWGFPLNSLAPNGGTALVRKPGPNILSTPNLAKLASQGIRATMSYSGSSICAPSRASIFLERHVGVIDCIRGNRNSARHEMVLPTGMRANFVTELSEAGYDTAYFGKWGLGVVQGGPWHHGFATYAGQLYHIEAHVYFPDYYYQFDSTLNKPQRKKDLTALRVRIPANARKRWNDNNCPLQPNSTCIHINDLLINKSLQFITDHLFASESRPFFLMFAPTYPHTGNYNANDSERMMQAPVKLISPSRLNQQPHVMRGHASQIEQHMDRDVGRILDLLEASAQGNSNTLFVFTSDNGATQQPPMGESIYIPSGGLRGAKRDMHEGGIRVPTILRWPGVFPSGVVSSVPFALYDLGPTFREMANLPKAPTHDAHGKPTLTMSMLQVWKNGNVSSIEARRYLHFEKCDMLGIDEQCSTATLDLKHYFIAKNVFKLVQSGNTEQLYNLRISPDERVRSNFRLKHKELTEARNAVRSAFTEKCEFTP